MTALGDKKRWLHTGVRRKRFFGFFLFYLSLFLPLEVLIKKEKKRTKRKERNIIKELPIGRAYLLETTKATNNKSNRATRATEQQSYISPSIGGRLGHFNLG